MKSKLRHLLTLFAYFIMCHVLTNWC